MSGPAATEPAAADPAELDAITACLLAAGRSDARTVAPSLVSYARALSRWQELARATIDAHTWPAHVVGSSPGPAA